MSLLTSTNELNSISSQFLLYNEGAMAGAPGPAGAQGPPGPQGVPGNDGANTFGTWLYNTNNPPSPEDLFLGPTDLVINYTAELPGGLAFLRAARNLFFSNGGTLTLSFQQEQGTFGPVSVSLLVSAFVMDDITGLATLTFTYIGGAVPPFVWAVGQSVNVVAIGGAAGPPGPPGAPGAPGGNDWWNYPAAGPVDLNGNDIIGLVDISMNGDISGATSITTSGAVAAGSVAATGAVSGGSISTAGAVSAATVSATGTVSGATLSASTLIDASSGTLNALNAQFFNQVDIYTDSVGGFGTLNVGPLNPLSANPAFLNVNGAIQQYRGFASTTVNANGLYIDGASIVPGAIGFKFGAIPVAGTNTCRLECNALTSPASIVGVAPLGITLDAGAASNFSSVGPTTVSTAADIILQAANQNVFVQAAPAGPGAPFCDLTLTNGGSLKNVGGLNGQTTGMNITNINALSGAAGGPGAGVIGLGNTLQGGAVNVQVGGDVISSFGGAAYSLNTVGARVAFQSTKVFYVSKQGNDANPGSQLAPKLTIQGAITAAEAAPALSAANFALIIVDKGKYVENLTFTKGYTVVSGVAGSQMDLNELTELTGNVMVNITAGASDLFSRQVVIENFQITGTIMDTSTVNHTLTLNNGRLFGTNKLLDMSGTATEYRLRLDNYTINQSSATANTDPMIRLSGPAAPGANGCQAFIYRLNATGRNNANVIRCEGCATIAQMAQSQLESTTANANAAAIVEFAGTVGSAGLSSFGQSSFAYTNSTLKTASANSTGILISGAYTALAPKILFVLSCFFALAGTVHPSNHIIKNVNGVANSTTVMFGAGSSAPTDNSPFLGSVRYTAVIDATNLNKLTAQTVS